MNRLFKYAMFFTAFIPLWITILFLDIMSITDETNNYIGSEVVGIGCIAIGLFLSAIIIFCSMRGVRSQNYTKYKILSAEQEKGITSEFLLSYILPLFAFDFLEQAEKLSVKTGRKAIELAKEKGKTSENRQWSDVVKDSEILSTEEQLGLSKEQIQQLKDKSLSKEERIEVAVLLLNETYSFGEVLKELDAGKTVEELEK